RRRARTERHFLACARSATAAVDRDRRSRCAPRRRLGRYRPSRDNRRRRSQRPSRGGSDPMTSIVVHYKELSLKGKNRPWFIQVLVRNIKTALAGLHVASVRSSMGRIELELRADSP